MSDEWSDILSCIVSCVMGIIAGVEWMRYKAFVNKRRKRKEERDE